MPVSWEFFAKRRLKNRDGVRAWAVRHGVASYEELIEALNLDDVIPPTKEQVEFLFSTDGATFIPSPPPPEMSKERGVATKRYTAEDSSNNPRDYGIYKEADEPSEESS